MRLRDVQVLLGHGVEAPPDELSNSYMQSLATHIQRKPKAYQAIQLNFLSIFIMILGSCQNIHKYPISSNFTNIQ
jgi:hypothetical protein